MQVPAYIPCHPKDATVLPFCVAALRRHPQVSAVTVIASRALEDCCAALGASFLDELELVAPWFTDEADPKQRWYYQMLLKLAITQSPQAPDRFLTIDADTVLLHDFPLLDERTGAALHPRMAEHHPPYYVGIEELLGRQVQYDGSYIAHFMVWRSALVREMFETFARVRGLGKGEGLRALREYLETCDAGTRWFGEYDTYGHFVREVAPDDIAWAERRQLNVLHVASTEAVLDRLRPFYDYVSFHAYRQSSNPLLRAAGAAWLSQRLLRDRIAALRGGQGPHATYEPQLDKFLRLSERWLGRDGARVVLELGARDCAETAELSRRLPDARIFTFECNPATLPVCRERVAALPNVSLVEAAVADRDGDIPFFPIDPEKTVTTWEDGNPGASSLLRASGRYPAETYVQDEITVPAVTLERFLREQGLPGVDLMWMDIQGAELMALRGAGPALATVKVIHAEVEFMEVYSGQPLFWEVKRFLNNAGFLLASFTHLGRFAGDAVFVRRDVLRGTAAARASAVDRASSAAAAGVRWLSRIAG